MNKNLNIDHIRRIVQKELRKIDQNNYRSGSILRIEVDCEEVDIEGWISAQDFDEKLIWSDRKRNLHIGAIGSVDKLYTTASAQFTQVYRQIEKKLSQASENVRYLGGFAFDVLSPVQDKWVDFGNYYFIIPRFELVRDHDRFFFAGNFLLNESTESKLLSDLNDIDGRVDRLQEEMPFLVSREQIPGKIMWERIIRQALENIQYGEYEKIVLARETHLQFAKDLNPFQILARLKTSNPESIHFCIQPQRGSAFLGGTPELLYMRDESCIYSEAIAGTRRRGIDKMDDSILEVELLNSQKDRNEHWFVIQKIREILNDFCDKVENGTDVTVLKLASVQHLLTHIHGILKTGVHDGQILSGLHPTPAVGGYPTEEALKSLNDLEPFRRGWYAAPVGWIGRNSAQFVVAIRSGLMHENNFFLYSGAGIVTGSDPHLEWEEIDTKIANFLRALDINGHIKARYRALTSAEQNYL